MIEPLIVEINTDLDAFELYSIFNEKETIFLDSGMDKERLGQYSFIALNPFIKFKYKNGRCNINGEIFQGDVFLELNKILKEYECINNTTLPFIGGGIGYFSYDLARDVEKLPVIARDDVEIPYCYYNFYDNIIIYSHKDNKVFLSALGIQQDKEESVQYITAKINSYQPINNITINKEENNFQSDFSKQEYIETVEKVRQYIRNGDIYITNLTQTFVGNVKKDALSTYKVLREINPAPFAAFMDLDEFSILCASPERFLQIRGNQVETRPIKGTRPRGNTEEEDKKFRDELLNSEKDKSELLMIVDLERNDLSRACKPHSVKVTQLFELEKYATVYHLVSTVVGELKEEYTAIDCIKACFPGGSITGTPKIRAMEIIEELEPVRRNIYTGCIGYLGFDGNVDLNIVIRTILMKDERAYIGVGGGITWESDSEEEYYETLQKAKALFNSLGLT